MTKPKVLADALVEAGIGEMAGGAKDNILYYAPDQGHEFMRQCISTDDFIKDWRVAGKCLELWPTTINTEQLDMTLDEMLRDPAAICEAFSQAIKAQENKQ